MWRGYRERKGKSSVIYSCINCRIYIFHIKFIFIIPTSFPEIFWKKKAILDYTLCWTTVFCYIQLINVMGKWKTQTVTYNSGQPRGGCSCCPGYGRHDPTSEGRTQVDHTVATSGVREGRTTRQLWTPYTFRGGILFCGVFVLMFFLSESLHFMNCVSINFS